MMRVAKFARALPALAWIALATPAPSQSPAGPIRPKPGVKPEAAPAETQPQERALLHVRVELVSAPVTVRDSHGELVLDLTQRDFRIFDNGVEQNIEHFDLGGDPLSIALVVETSSRIEALLPAIHKAGIIFTQIVMGPTGEAAVLGYDDSISVLQPFTGNADQVEKTIEHLRMGTSGVRLYDALSRAVSLLEAEPVNRRRVIVALGEAADSGSEDTLGNVVREAQLANIAIYSVGLSSTMAALRAKPSEAQPTLVGPPGTFPVPTRPGAAPTPSVEAQSQGVGNIDLLAAILWLVKTGTNAVGQNSLALASAGTGGSHMNTFRERSIETALDQIGGELHAQYTLSYRPPGEEPSGFHEIKVTVDRPGLRVRTRPGYYLPPPPAS